MFSLFSWFKIVIITVLLMQQSFIVAEPMNCEEHPKESSNMHMVQKGQLTHHEPQNVSNHHHAKQSFSTKQSYTDEECEKCKMGGCMCCEGGYCASVHISAFLVQEKDNNIKSLHPELISGRIPSLTLGINISPYRPPIIS